MTDEDFNRNTNLNYRGICTDIKIYFEFWRIHLNHYVFPVSSIICFVSVGV